MSKVKRHPILHRIILVNEDRSRRRTRNSCKKGFRSLARKAQELLAVGAYGSSADSAMENPARVTRAEALPELWAVLPKHGLPLFHGVTDKSEPLVRSPFQGRRLGEISINSVPFSEPAKPAQDLSAKIAKIHGPGPIV